MIFSNDKAIYVQIAERLSDEILAGKYKEDERIPSVREYAVLLEVNANTTVKAYDLLATDEIIYNKRGLGYFVSAGAKKQIKKTRKKEFMKERLPELARQMQLLDISIEGAMNGSFVLSIGMMRAKAANALTNLVYNIFRYAQICIYHPQLITCKG